MRKLKRKIISSCASLILLCCLCSIPVALFRISTSTSTPENTPIAEIASSSIPENTAIAEIVSTPTAIETTSPTTTEASTTTSTQQVIQTETVAASFTQTKTSTHTIAPSNTAMPTPTVQPTLSQDILTIENNEDMAALFRTGDFDPFISEFAEKYSGRTIQFDGYIANIMLHGDYKTRYDILIYTGNYGESSGNALSFKFEDINIVWDLKLTGPNIPEFLSEGQNLRITAEVVEYNENSGLFFLKPVSTEIRP